MNEAGEKALRLGEALDAPEHLEDLRIIATRFLCPMDRTPWVIETLGTELPGPIEPSKLGAALLCGACEARRRLMFRGKDGLILPLWTKRDADRLWAILLDARDRGETTFQPRHKFREDLPSPERILRDDRDAELRRILYDGGRRRAAITEEGIRALGLDWKIPTGVVNA